MIKDYRFFVQEKVLKALGDEHFSGLGGRCTLYMWPKNYGFEEEIKDGENRLIEIELNAPLRATSSLIKKPQK